MNLRRRCPKAMPDAGNPLAHAPCGQTPPGDNPRMEKLRVLMVCMGNICRSPTAEAVLRHKLRERGLDGLVEVDSAGTHGWHAGAPPDARSQEHASRRGYDLSALRARSLVAADFD